MNMRVMSDNYYGTPKAYVEEQLAAGHDVILEIEIQGARKIKEQYPDAVLLFVTTKDAMTLKERLEGRGTEITGGDCPATGTRCAGVRGHRRI